MTYTLRILSLIGLIALGLGAEKLPDDASLFANAPNTTTVTDKSL